MPSKTTILRAVAYAGVVINVLGGAFAAGRGGEPIHVTVHAALALAFGWWAGRLGRGPVALESGTDSVQAQLEQQAAALDDVRAALADQTRQVSELQERLDFTERVLTKAKDRLGT